MDKFNTVPLPLKSICPFTSFWLQDISHLHPISESCFCEPLNLAGLSPCMFWNYCTVFGSCLLSSGWKLLIIAELEYPHITIWAGLDPECQDGSSLRGNSQKEKIKTRPLQALRKMLPWRKLFPATGKFCIFLHILCKAGFSSPFSYKQTNMQPSFEVRIPHTVLPCVIVRAPSSSSPSL